MEAGDDVRIPVEPTRIGAMGVGSFLVLAGGILLLASWAVGAAFLRDDASRTRLRLVAAASYAALIAFLASAKRRSRWAVPEEVASDVDDTWLVHVLAGTTVVIGFVLGLFAMAKFDFLTPVLANEIETERDRGHGRTKTKFLF